MKKFIFLILALVMAIPQTIGQTYFKPFNFQTSKEPVDIYLNGGARFVGTKQVSTNNGQVTSISYWGTAILPDGGKLITATAGYGFNQNLQFTDGCIWEIDPSGEVYVYTYSNGVQQSRVREYRPYTISDNCIVFPSTSSSGGYVGGGYDGGSYNSGSSNSGNSYNRHEAICRGCNGTGKCHRCGGSGWTDYPRIKCSTCHSTGTCQSCAGVGKKYGNY